MSRTSALAVQKLLAPGRDYDTKLQPSIEPFITTASIIVDGLASAATSDDNTQTDAKLEIIERWLAAHCYKLSDRQYQITKTGDSAATFTGVTGLNLKSTTYGQMALTLDDTGYLAKLGDTKKVGFISLQRDPEYPEF